MGGFMQPTDAPRRREPLTQLGSSSVGSVVVRAFVGRFDGLVLGTDGRWSTSKVAVVLWLYAAIFAFLAICFHTRGASVPGGELNDQYFALLGIPAAAAVAAKGITQSKWNAGLARSKAPKPSDTNVTLGEGIGHIFGDDANNVSLLDTEYVAFNLLLLVFFFFGFFGAPDHGLPKRPQTLVAAAGIGAAGYLAGKQVTDDPAVPPAPQAAPQVVAPQAAVPNGPAPVGAGS
jgi:hypothetical protein